MIIPLDFFVFVPEEHMPVEVRTLPCEQIPLIVGEHGLFVMPERCKEQMIDEADWPSDSDRVPLHKPERED